jgi:tetratricopeptide (TPR) repeat protein
MKRLIPALAALLLATTAVQAADTAPAPGPALGPALGASTQQDPLTGARALIAANKWAAAIDELKRVEASGNADWNNLMGYSHRKAKSPDYAAAERYYDTALRLNPTHRGALEYSGELFLMLGDLPRAQQRLAALDKACLLPCDEYTGLKSAVARFKANGNRYVAAP